VNRRLLASEGGTHRWAVRQGMGHVGVEAAVQGLSALSPGLSVGVHTCHGIALRARIDRVCSGHWRDTQSDGDPPVHEAESSATWASNPASSIA